MQAVESMLEVLTAANTRLIFIGSSTPQQTSEFLQRCDPHPPKGDLYTDPSVGLYGHFQLKRGVFRSLVRPFFTAFTTYGVRGVMEGVKLGKETSHLAGDSWQQGGTVLLDQQGNILYLHAENHPADWPSMEEVLGLVGISGKQVDYKKALADWLKLRDEARRQQKS